MIQEAQDEFDCSSFMNINTGTFHLWALFFYSYTVNHRAHLSIRQLSEWVDHHVVVFFVVDNHKMLG